MRPKALFGIMVIAIFLYMGPCWMCYGPEYSYPSPTRTPTPGGGGGGGGPPPTATPTPICCIDNLDPKDSMGLYSLKEDSFWACKAATAWGGIDQAWYVDPISVVFYDDATAARLEEEAVEHGFPALEHEGQQRFWELQRCGLEDVDAGENGGGCCPVGCSDFCPEIDSWERMHFRAAVGAEEPNPHVDLGTFAVATPHFDDDCWPGGHFVPEVYPYWDQLCPTCEEESGFVAGRYYLYRQFTDGGEHSFYVGNWRNTKRIHQGCGGDQWPKSDGYVYYIRIWVGG